jgi:predicted histidine transporter YuiF (NhaC family)
MVGARIGAFSRVRDLTLTRAAAQQDPTISSFLLGSVVMVVGVVLPLAVMYLKNRQPRRRAVDLLDGVAGRTNALHSS